MKNRIYGLAVPAKTVLVAGSLALVLAACGGGDKVGNLNTEAKQTMSPSKETSQPLKPDELPKALLDGKYKEMYERFSQPLKDDVSEADFKKIGDEFTKGLQTLERSSSMQLNGFDRRLWLSEDGKKGLLGVFDPEGVIMSIQVQPLTTWPETDKKLSKQQYAWPLPGEWFVFWGGENVLLNYHYEHEAQRYSYDLIQVKDGFSYKGDPLKNESYYAFGKNIIAPGDGSIVSVVNDIKDNEPVGVMNPNQPAGNNVVIDHGDGEFSHLAHFKKGSATVKPGDKVKKGDVIGLVGNSGNSSEAHLHVQLSDGADLFKSRSININWEEGLKPLQGDTITIAE
ncbi:Peptidase family M23 [Paenibacillaceae bacterium GAS479]|nr:Peptidase family M23 [Paenibacillaceae bacterium GAS479]